MSDRVASTVTFEVIRNRLVAITEEMRIALQSVSGSPTVTEASDFFTGLFLPDGQVVSMGFQVAFQAPVCRALIQHINGQLPKYKPRDGDMYVGSDPYIGALHQNDVQMVGPIYAGDKIIAWAGVQAHQTDVGGMDFASWSPKAREVYQEGLRIPCVKLVDRGETREDVIDFIVNGSRLPNLLGLDIRAFIATLNVARSRIDDLVTRYGAALVGEVMERMIASSETRIRARLKELPDGEFHAADFLEHDGHENILYKIDVHLTKRGDHLKLDFSGSSKQAPGFINATRCGLVGGVCGSIMPTLAYDIQWNQGVMAPVEIIAPDLDRRQRDDVGAQQAPHHLAALSRPRARHQCRCHGDLQPGRHQPVRRALRSSSHGPHRGRRRRLGVEGRRQRRRPDHLARLDDRRRRAQ
jgi:N-methylhydantoinase B